MLQHFWPLTLQSSRRLVRLDDTTLLKRIDHADCMKLLGIERVSFTTNGLLASIKHRTDAPWHVYRQLYRPFDPTQNLLINFANFLLVTDDRSQAERAAFAMKLVGMGSSGPYFGFTENARRVEYLRYCPYRGYPLVELDATKCKKVRSTFRQLDRQDPKLRLLVEKFMYAESAGVPSDAIRLLELAVILEMLFLPVQEAELSYRFSLRIAKCFHRHLRLPAAATFEEAKNVYGLRSKVAHKGTCRMESDSLDIVRKMAKRAIDLYLHDPSIFTEANLHRLCLET